MCIALTSKYATIFYTEIGRIHENLTITNLTILWSPEEQVTVEIIIIPILTQF